jgi:hypothetical protein
LVTKLNEELQTIHRRGGDTEEALRRAKDAQQLIGELRKRPRPTHDDLRAERDRRMGEVNREFDRAMRVVLGSRGFSDLSHWRH